MMQHLFTMLKHTAETTPDRIAYTESEQQTSYACLCRNAEAVGSHVAQAVPPRSAVAILVDARSSLCVTAMMGVLAAGCFYAPLDPALPEERLRLILNNLQPRLILADEKALSKAAAAYPDAPAACLTDVLQTSIDHALLQARGDAIRPDDLAMVLYTSGSTGVPKGVAHTQQGMVTWTNTTIAKYGFTPETVLANLSPFYYANSLLELFVPMLLGARVVMILPSYLTFPKRLLRCLKEERVTELCMTPSSFVVVANSGVLAGECLPELTMFIMSGEVMPKAQLQQWMDAAPNAAAMNFYGSTETLSVAVDPVTFPENGHVIPVGQLLPGVALRLMTDEGRSAAPGEMGEIFVQSPMVTVGYYRDDARTQASLVADPLGQAEGRWFRTGDYGIMDGAGALSVVGRMDNMIKHHGYRMELGEVEAAVRQAPGCKEACCLLDKGADEIWCFAAGEVQSAALAMYLKTHLAKYMLPDCFVILPEMPHNANMKIDRGALRQMMGAAASHEERA